MAAVRWRTSWLGAWQALQRRRQAQCEGQVATEELLVNQRGGARIPIPAPPSARAPPGAAEDEEVAFLYTWVLMRSILGARTQEVRKEGARRVLRCRALALHEEEAARSSRSTGDAPSHPET